MLRINSSLPLIAAAFSMALVIAVSLRHRRSIPGFSFAAGMMVFAAEAVVEGLGARQSSIDAIGYWEWLALAVRSLIPGLWLMFSLTYSRGDSREFLRRWRWIVVLAFILPAGLVLFARTDLLQVISFAEPSPGWWIQLLTSGKVLNAIFLISSVLILMNLERTFRASIGTMRWRIKFLLLGLGVIFGARFYMRSQALIFSGYDLSFTSSVHAVALIVGCALMGAAYFRRGFGEIDVYPSRAVLQTSMTVLLAGGYLFFVGLLAQVMARLGGIGAFPLQALFVLLAIVWLAVLLLSNRFRQKTELFISRHFKRPVHDFRKTWTDLTRSTSAVLDEVELSEASSKLLSETFHALSVSIWLFDERQEQLVRASSTLHSDHEEDGLRALFVPHWRATSTANFSRPFELEASKETWVEPLKSISAGHFRTGGNRICVPLVAGEQRIGVILLADRVNGLRYSGEETDLLKCIGDQVAVSLLNIRLSKEMMIGRELEAFQSISAFFVHDLKNAASTLSLMLQNLPVHFDDAAFRQDALRGVGSTVERINGLISRLSALPQELELQLSDVDLNHLVDELLTSLNRVAWPEVMTDLQTVERVRGDCEKLQSVVTNLLFNARDASNGNGQISVATRQQGQMVILSVTDNGCGMSPAFIQRSLFRPFATTKKKGLGIGMFQSKMIVEAHHGRIQVKSVVGSGTTFEIMLPLKTQTK
jgi:putative PEP-CTERM system histidine kinase